MGVYSSNYRYVFEIGKLVHGDEAVCGFKNYRIIEYIGNLQKELYRVMLIVKIKLVSGFENYREYIEIMVRTGSEFTIYQKN